MKMLRLLLLSTTLALCGAASAAAQSTAQASPSPETLQAANDLVGLVSASVLSDVADNITAQSWPSIESALRNRNPKLDATTLAELHVEFKRQIIDGVADVMQNAPAIYARHFSTQELRDLAAFYRTTLGTKVLKETPQVMAELNALMVPHLQGLLERVNLTFLNILQKRGYYAQ